MGDLVYNCGGDVEVWCAGVVDAAGGEVDGTAGASGGGSAIGFVDVVEILDEDLAWTSWCELEELLAGPVRFWEFALEFEILGLFYLAELVEEVQDVFWFRVAWEV